MSQRVESKKRQPIRPSVVKRSALSSDWEFTEANTKELTHSIHRYSGKFIPQIARRAISAISRPGDIVLDPYCGSGTTLLEATLLGRRCIGVDLSPLAVLLARVKTTPIRSDELKGLYEDMWQQLGQASAEVPLFAETLPLKGRQPAEEDRRLSDPWYTKWYQPDVLRELVGISRIIESIETQPIRDVARVAFSDILRKSSNAHSGYPNVMFDKRAPVRSPPTKPFLRALSRVCAMVSELNGCKASWSDVEVRLGCSTNLSLEDQSIDAVVSHPPYIGSIPYAEYGMLSLQWLGTDHKELDQELTGGRRQRSDVVERFRTGYSRMLLECARVLRPRAFAFLMVGNPVVRGERIDLADMTVEFGRKAGLNLIVRTERVGVNRRANKMGAEHLLFLRNEG